MLAALDLSPLLQWAQGLNWIDIVLLLGLFAGLLFGIGVGFYRQVAIFTALVVGLVAAARLATPLAASDAFVPVAEALGADGARIAAFAGVLWAALLLGFLACLVFHSFFSRSIRIFDGLLGGAMGVAISGLLFGLILLGIFHSGQTRLDEPIRNSLIGSQLAEGARFAAQWFPEDIQRRFDRALPAPGSPAVRRPGRPGVESVRDGNRATSPRPADAYPAHSVPADSVERGISARTGDR